MRTVAPARHRRPSLLVAGVLWATVAIQQCLSVQSAHAAAPTRFEISFPKRLEAGPLTGRLIVAISSKIDAEPRSRIYPGAAAIFGIDVNEWRAGETVLVDAQADAYPFQSLRDLPQGAYQVQALLIRYELYRRADGRQIWAPFSRDTFNLTPNPELAGNLYSKPATLHVGPDGFAQQLPLDRRIEPAPPPADTELVRHIKIRSKLLSEFWGRPIFLGASVLVPRGFDDHPRARYPIAFTLLFGQRPLFINPDPASHAQELASMRDANLQTGYEFYRSWLADDMPRFLAASLYQQTPYFADSYSVDSANNGPYGRAVVEELIPAIEEKFRAIGQPHARLVEGASTGGWSALALQLKHPDFFGGAWVFNPDPICFERYQLVDIYKDQNAFTFPLSEWHPGERPFRRTRNGQSLLPLRDLARYEAVLGSRGRSGGQLDAWQAVHGPTDADGYPKPLFDKATGAIDREVASYMREQGYDLQEYTRRNWNRIGPSLVGKLNFFAGEMDDFFLNLAVYRFQDMLAATQSPHYPGRFEYGRPMKGHNWHLTDFSAMIREMAEHVRKNAPAGASTEQWNY